MTTTEQVVTVAYDTDDDAYRVEIHTVGDPFADEVIPSETGDESDARDLAQQIAQERGLRFAEHDSADVQKVTVPATQAHELAAWLGDDHGLTDDEFTDLLRIANEIGERYPDPDLKDEREAALTAAYRFMIEGNITLTTDLATDLLNARIAEARALAGLEQAATMLIPGATSELGFAKRAGVDRMTVRKWLGKR